MGKLIVYDSGASPRGGNNGIVVHDDVSNSCVFIAFNFNVQYIYVVLIP